MNVFSILEEAAGKWPDKVAMVHAGRSFRYGELLSAVESLAAALRRAGVRAGDKVGLICSNKAECLAASFAIFRSEAILVPLSPALKATEIARLSSEVGLDALLSGPEFKGLVQAGEKRPSGDIDVFARRPALGLQIGADRKTPEAERRALMKIHAATIRFTSGTMSEAKAIVLSHPTLMKRLGLQSVTLTVTENDRILWLQPIILGIGGPFFAYLLRGSCFVIADSLETSRLSEPMGRYRATQVHAPPLFYRMLVNETGIAAKDLVGVKHFVCTGGPLAKGVAEAFRDRFGREVVHYYGLVECGRVLGNFNEDPGKRGSVGTPDGYEIELDTAGFHQDGAGPVGELLIRGPGMFDAFYCPFRPLDDLLQDGWLRSGDIARRDVDGYYWIVGRTKEIINVGGMKVFPRELEELLMTHPDVEEAIVRAAPEPRFGEAPVAKVKLREGGGCTAGELLRYANAKVAFFKALRSVELVSEIPKTVTGKPIRRES